MKTHMEQEQIKNPQCDCRFASDYQLEDGHCIGCSLHKDFEKAVEKGAKLMEIEAIKIEVTSEDSTYEQKFQNWKRNKQMEMDLRKTEFENEMSEAEREIAEREANSKIEIKHIDLANSKIERDKILDIVESGTKQFQLVLFSIVDFFVN